MCKGSVTYTITESTNATYGTVSRRSCNYRQDGYASPAYTVAVELRFRSGNDLP